MYTKVLFRPKDMFWWTRHEIGFFFIICIIEVLLYKYTAGLLSIPFTPIAVLGTALAFIIGFQSNAAYGRIWEARMIWGAIVNSSRTFAMMVQSFVNEEHSKESVETSFLQQEVKTIIYRHIAWLTALRYAMREKRPWEYFERQKSNAEWADAIYVPEFKIPFDEAIKPYLNQDDLDYISNKNNKQTAVLYRQSDHLSRLKNKGLIWEFAYLELENVIEELFTHQGKSERIKNFPYPRQFASMLFYITWIFIVLFPLGCISQFSQAGADLSERFANAEHWFIWLSVPFCVIVMWVFYTMNRIGRIGENPFEGSPNDVPISAISRGIEIDLRQNLGENAEDIPPPFEVRKDTQM